MAIRLRNGAACPRRKYTTEINTSTKQNPNNITISIGINNRSNRADQVDSKRDIRFNAESTTGLQRNITCLEQIDGIDNKQPGENVKARANRV